MSTNDLPQSSSTGTVPVEEAKKNAENWAIYLDSSSQKFNAESYLIPIISFQNLLGNNPDAEAVRIYIGLSDAENPSSSRLFMVPIVNGHEKLFRLTPPGDPGNPPGDPKDDSNVYDMAKPCPPDCGNGGGGPGGGEKLGR